ncbi:hypothetical protein PGB90_004806 [Kerria lacca]
MCRFFFFFSKSDKGKTSWWEKKVSSPCEADGAADQGTHVPKVPGSILSDKTLEEVRKSPNRFKI